VLGGQHDVPDRNSLTELQYTDTCWLCNDSRAGHDSVTYLHARWPGHPCRNAELDCSARVWSPT